MGLQMTPFEKELGFWRQLWRVIERSDVVVQIVDARNPLLFRSNDLAEYVKEVSPLKENVLLINKADYLTPRQRQFWADYFTEENVRVVFWSAVLEVEKQEALTKKERQEKEAKIKENKFKNKDILPRSDRDHDNDDSNEYSSDDDNSNDQGEERTCAECGRLIPEDDPTCACQTEQDLSDILKDLELNQKQTKKNDTPTKDVANSANLLSGEELLEFLRELYTNETVKEGVTTIGMVGYPNVGKSSTINAIINMKKVPVSATPGRTKHFQTIYVEESLMLCDCPGLVMPMFINTKADMIISGILSIDHMRDYASPTTLLCKMIPRDILEATYGVILQKPREGEDPDRPPNAHELLSAYGKMKGLMTHKGVPDYRKSATRILKDFVNGRLLYCEPPPNVSVEEFQPTRKVADLHHIAKVSQATVEKMRHMVAHSGGRYGVQGYTRRSGINGQFSTVKSCVPALGKDGMPLKPSKVAMMLKKQKGPKTKLRKKYAYLDMHD